MGVRNRVGKGLSYRPAGLNRLAKSILWNRFLGSLEVLKYHLCSSLVLFVRFKICLNGGEHHKRTRTHDPVNPMNVNGLPEPFRTCGGGGGSRPQSVRSTTAESCGTAVTRNRNSGAGTPQFQSLAGGGSAYIRNNQVTT
jgi:hypothetical protein